LCATIPTELGAFIANKATTKLAWESIAMAHVGEDRVHRATLQRLRGEWEGLAFQPSKQIKDFAVRLTNLMEQMARNGDTDLTEERAVEKFLRCMPKKYAQIVMWIETLLDFEQLTVRDVTGRLKAVQDREKGPHVEPGAAGGKLLYMMEQWRAFEKRKKEDPDHPAPPRNVAGVHTAARRRRSALGVRQGADGGATGEHKVTQDDTCNNCGRCKVLLG
jgi:hypothetical protein